MRTNVGRLAVLGLAWGLATGAPVGAEEGHHGLLTDTEIDAALQLQTAHEARQRRGIEELLAREEVRAIAERSGLDLQGASEAVRTLDPEDLEEVARLAAGIEQELEGGDHTIHMSVVTLLLIVIIVILLAD